MPSKEIFGISQITSLRSPLWRQLIAEFFGVLFIVFIGCGSALDGWNANDKAIDEPLDVSTVVRIALAFGLTVAAVVELTGHVSGGHVNPAVTIGLLSVGRIAILPAIFYILAQLLGGLTGAALLKALSPDEINQSLGANKVQKLLNGAQGFGVEFIITALLIFTVFAVTDKRRASEGRGSASLAIGIAVTVGHLLAIKFTGCGMNPARVFGPAVMTGNWDHHWAYWFGECGGAVFAALFYVAVFAAEEPLLARFCGSRSGSMNNGGKVENIPVSAVTESFHHSSMRLKSAKALGVTEVIADPLKIARALVAEYVATTLLLTVGIASGLPDKSGFEPNVFQSSIGGGLAIISAIQMSINVSGAHLNPAITVPLFVVGRIKFIKTVLYIIVQCIAGITAVMLLKTFLPEELTVDNLFVKPGDGLENYQIFGIEFIATMTLVLAGCTLADNKIAPVRGVECLLMGFVVISLQLFALKFSGCGLNPARILGPAILKPADTNWQHIWIYCVAEISGGITAAVFYFLVLHDHHTITRVLPRPRMQSILDELKIISRARNTVSVVSHQ
uniref:Aquaporin n=1 Tax=Strigamia maritima TaxID=126957 RepID=T1IHJ3_STRMM